MNCPMKSNYTVALEVIAGKWGNGQERMVNLTKAGYDAEAVQSIVNAVILDGYKEEPDKENFLEIEVDLSVYNGINLKFKQKG